MTNDESIQNQELKLLYEKYIANEISEAEFHRLYDALLLPDKEAYLKELMTVQWHATNPIPGFDVDAIPLPELDTGKVIDMPARTPIKRITRIAVAAALLLLSGSALYYWGNLIRGNEKESNPLISETIVHDVLPGTNKATLTLADGSVILLDSVAAGNLTNQGNTQIIKLDSGQLAYNTTNSYEPIAIPQYNVITTPRGGQYSIVLPDGSKVWLNAASSLKFPTAFVGKERLVELVGEGFFEVAKNTAKPFKVRANQTIVEAVGTAFNINAYNDEPTQNTTLVEGKVKLSSPANEIMLSPGQQAVVKEGNSIRVHNITNMEEIIGWKDAWFHFDDIDIQSIMRQVSRWYDVDIKYEGSIQKRYTADIERGLPVSRVLGLLEKTQTIKFKIDKRTITVAPVQ